LEALEAADEDFNDDMGSGDESWNSEDDPEKLWCICRQPHNNRFMICCDGCEEWFHGQCVGISKQMGKYSLINPLPPSGAVRKQKKKYFRGSFQFSIVTI